jgi:hypothetical protein
LWKKIARHREAKDRWAGTFFLFIIRAREIIRLTVANVKVSIDNRLLNQWYVAEDIDKKRGCQERQKRKD